MSEVKDKKDRRSPAPVDSDRVARVRSHKSKKHKKKGSRLETGKLPEILDVLGDSVEQDDPSELYEIVEHLGSGYFRH